MANDATQVTPSSSSYEVEPSRPLSLALSVSGSPYQRIRSVMAEEASLIHDLVFLRLENLAGLYTWCDVSSRAQASSIVSTPRLRPLHQMRCPILTPPLRTSTRVGTAATLLDRATQDLDDLLTIMEGHWDDATVQEAFVQLYQRRVRQRPLEVELYVAPATSNWTQTDMDGTRATQVTARRYLQSQAEAYLGALDASTNLPFERTRVPEWMTQWRNGLRLEIQHLRSRLATAHSTFGTYGSRGWSTAPR